nr:MAG TPA: hypothetical protein [Caudoviricetes sp.]
MGGETHHSLGLSVLAHGQALLFFVAYRRQTVHLITSDALFLKNVLASPTPAVAAVAARRRKAVCTFVTQPPCAHLRRTAGDQVSGLCVIHGVPHDMMNSVIHT